MLTSYIFIIFVEYICTNVKHSLQKDLDLDRIQQ
jgi:hypothetical protein